MVVGWFDIVAAVVVVVVVGVRVPRGFCCF